MENKYYLTFLKLIEDNTQGALYYECIYENGIMTKIVTIPYEENLIIETKLI
jgi:hypothetical protein